MADAKKPEQAQGATPTDVKKVIAALLTAPLQLTNESISGMFRGANVRPNVSIADLEKMSFGAVNSSVRKGDIFKLVGLRVIEQDVQGTKRTLLLGIVQNTKGEQRAIYMSSLFRTTPQANSEKNKYDDDVLSFDLGIMQNTNGMPTPKRIEKLMGNGSDYIHVTDEISYEVTATRQVDGNGPDQKAGTEFTSRQRVFRLEHISEADALAADNVNS